MARRKPKPVVLTGRPATPEDIVKIFNLSKETVERLTAMVEATPGLRDSNAKVIRRYRQRALSAGS